jgi:hypothetical protein
MEKTMGMNMELRVGAVLVVFRALSACVSTREMRLKAERRRSDSLNDEGRVAAPF